MKAIADEFRERRKEWLNHAVYRLRPIMRKRTGLIVPSVKIRVARTMADGMAGVAFPNCEYGKPAIVIRNEDYSGRPWVAFGRMIHELIHDSGVWNHSPTFAKAARQMELAGKPRFAGFGSVRRWYDVPIYARGILSQMGGYPTAIRDLPIVWEG